MNLCAKIALVTAVAALILANFIHSPIPEDTPERMFVQLLNDMFSLGENIVS